MFPFYAEEHAVLLAACHSAHYVVPLRMSIDHRVLRRISGPERGRNRSWRKLRTAEFHDL
jgi:hypothetical protein